jgi:hypothetical protein
MSLAPPSKAQRFIDLYATGEYSQAAAYVAAGYSPVAPLSNASKMVRKYAAEIEAAREKLGLRSEPESKPVDDADRADLVAAQRKLYADALASGDLRIQRAALRAIERLLKPKRGPGRPTTNKPETAKPQHPERDAARADAIVAALLLPEDLETIDAAWGNNAPPWGRVLQVRSES